MRCHNIHKNQAKRNYLGMEVAAHLLHFTPSLMNKLIPYCENDRVKFLILFSVFQMETGASYQI